MQRQSRWHDIRALRAAPPGLAATDPERRAVFGAALRQAEELFAAARVSGFATKPLSLFYCFSQALRAISAAHVNDNAWRVVGHGASVHPASTVTNTMVTPRPRIGVGSRDSLSALLRVLNAPPPTEPMRLGDVWKASPDTPDPGPAELDTPSAIFVRPSPHPNRLQEVRGEGRVEFALAGMPLDISDAEVEARLEGYPTLRGSTSVRRSESASEGPGNYDFAALQPRFHPEGRVFEIAPWARKSPVRSWTLETRAGAEMSQEDEALRAFASVAPLAINDQIDVRIAMPAIGGVDAPEFTVLWWVLLIGLSSVVRYEPEAWVASIDVDTSQLAVPLERLCEMAEEFLPAMLSQLLEEPAPEE